MTKKITKSKIVKKKKDEVATPGYALLMDDGNDYPDSDYVSPEIDEKFYTKEYSMDAKQKKMLVELVSRKEFRVFEKYIDWRVNASAHRMKSFLISGKTSEAMVEAAGIDALVKVTQDMANFWQEVKLMEKEDDVLLRKAQTELARAYGDDKFILDMGSNETFSI